MKIKQKTTETGTEDGQYRGNFDTKIPKQAMKKPTKTKQADTCKECGNHLQRIIKQKKRSGPYVTSAITGIRQPVKDTMFSKKEAELAEYLNDYKCRECREENGKKQILEVQQRTNKNHRANERRK